MVRVTTYRSSASLFLLGALSILLIALTLVRSSLFAMNPDVLAWGLTFDLTLMIPLLYYVFLVRPGHARAATTGVVFVVCCSVAARVIPASQHTFLRDLSVVTAALEILLIAFLVRRVSTLRHGVRNGDAVDRIEKACAVVFGETRVANFIASEVAILYYALFTWRQRPSRDKQTMTVHERSGWGSILACILVLIAAESIGLHLLIQMKSVIAAWIVTALDIYGVLWLLGDYQALRLRPTRIESDVIRLRYGLRWQADISRSQIASIERVTSEADWKRRDVLKVAMLEEPSHVIVLTEPIRAQGLAGITKTVRAVAVLPDDAAAFENAISAWPSVFASTTTLR